ncbi:MAG TPA: hypothetical protein VFA86_10900 [Gammaproteobacteria bacterium]|nr:hypothetical protein [Gammaproteobacteria bacterium]
MADDRTASRAPVSDEARWSAVAEWYHAFFTGLVLTAVTRLGTREAAELVFRIFRHQHLQRFLPGIRKLGLERLPPAVTAARYHYLSNAIGGVRVEYVEESPRKVWIRYPPPRWAWAGTAVCAVPGEVSRAMLRGWHAHNGVSLGVPRLGFVCTGQTMEGQPGLEGYYIEYDRDITPDQRLRFSPGEEAPAFDPAQAPALPTADWPGERLQKARRNYAMEYVRTALPQLIALRGPAEGAWLGNITGRLIGMQFHAATAAALGLPDSGDGTDFARFVLALARAQGDHAEAIDDGGPPGVRQSTCRLTDGVPHPHPAAFDAWNGLLEGALAAHDRRLVLKVTARPDQGEHAFEWRVVSRGPAGAGPG